MFGFKRKGGDSGGGSGASGDADYSRIVRAAWKTNDYKPLIELARRICRRKLIPELDGDDIIAEAVKIAYEWKIENRIADIVDPGAYFYGTVVGRIIEYRRKKARRDMQEEVPEEIPAHDLAFTQIEGEEILKLAEPCLKKTGKGENLLIVKLRMKGLSLEEIARLVGLPDATVRARVGPIRKCIDEAYREVNGTAPPKKPPKASPRSDAEKS